MVCCSLSRACSLPTAVATPATSSLNGTSSTHGISLNRSNFAALRRVSIQTSTCSSTTDLDGVAKLLAILTLDLRPVLGLRAISREVALLLTVAASDKIGVARLIAFLGYVILRSAVTASSRRSGFHVRALRSCQQVKMR